MSDWKKSRLFGANEPIPPLALIEFDRRERVSIELNLPPYFAAHSSTDGFFRAIPWIFIVKDITFVHYLRIIEVVRFLR